MLEERTESSAMYFDKVIFISFCKNDDYKLYKTGKNFHRKLQYILSFKASLTFFPFRWRMNGKYQYEAKRNLQILGSDEEILSKNQKTNFLQVQSFVTKTSQDRVEKDLYKVLLNLTLYLRPSGAF